MTIDERARLIEIYRLAQQIATELAPFTHGASEDESLNLRLAHAHALGLADQLAEVLGSRSVVDALRSLRFVPADDVFRTH